MKMDSNQQEKQQGQGAVSPAEDTRVLKAQLKSLTELMSLQFQAGLERELDKSKRVVRQLKWYSKRMRALEETLEIANKRAHHLQLQLEKAEDRVEELESEQQREEAGQVTANDQAVMRQLQDENARLKTALATLIHVNTVGLNVAGQALAGANMQEQPGFRQPSP